MRKSFKHPIGGLVVGLVMVLAPVLSVLDVFGAGLALSSPARGIGGFCMFLCGVYLLWSVVTRKNEPWIAFVLRQGERAFPLKTELSASEADVLVRSCASHAVMGDPPLQRAMGFEVLPPKPPVPEKT